MEGEKNYLREDNVMFYFTSILLFKVLSALWKNYLSREKLALVWFSLGFNVVLVCVYVCAKDENFFLCFSWFFGLFRNQINIGQINRRKPIYFCTYGGPTKTMRPKNKLDS